MYTKTLTRRSILQKLGGAILAVPLIGTLIRSATAKEGATCAMFSSVGTEAFSLDEMARDPDRLLSQMSDGIQSRLSILLKEAHAMGLELREVDLCWVNVLDHEFNPNGRRGFFRVTARASAYPPVG